MVLRFLFRYLTNNEHLVQKLSESYPVRRAAKIFVTYYYRGQHAIQDSEIRKNITPERIRDFFTTFTRNLKTEMENAKKELENKRK